MLSPGTWHKRVPKDLHGNLLFRRWLLGRAQGDVRIQAALREACRLDLLFFINVFVWQYNAQHVGDELGPFVTWPFQDDACRQLLSSIEGRERSDVAIIKSREMGASWLCLIVMLWLFLFHPWKKFLLISRSADAVDKKADNDALFWKFEFILSYLPDWIADGKVRRREMGLRHTGNNSVITGQASTGRAGVGGRATAVFVDEFSQINEDFEVLDRTADTSGCRIFNFTHTGLDTAAYQLSEREDVKKLLMHWSMHPEKNQGLYRYDPETNKVEVLDKSFHYPPDFQFVMDGTPGGPFAGLRSPFYDAEEKRRHSKRAVAMDLDIDPRGATAQFFDSALIKSLQASTACEPYWQGDISYDRDTGRPLDLIPVRDGPLKLWCHINVKGQPPIDDYGAGADLSTGSGATPSCISIQAASTGEKVLEYTTAFMDPISLAPLVMALCWLFKNEDGEGALLAWEMQGPGIVFGKTVIDLGYRRVYYRTAEHALSMKVSDTPGWVPTPNNQRVMLEDYRAALSTRRFVNRSWRALDECLAFVYDGVGKVRHGGEASVNDPTGARENHGDRVVGDGLAWKMTKTLKRGKPKEEPDQLAPNALGWRRQYHEGQKKTVETW